MALGPRVYRRVGFASVRLEKGIFSFIELAVLQVIERQRTISMALDQ